MLRYAAMALIVALVSLLVLMLGGGAVWLGKLIFFVALGVFIVLFGWDMFKRYKGKRTA